MKTIAITVVALLCCVVSMAQVQVRGTVVSQDGTPIAYASVQVDSQYTMTDREGHFEMAVPAGHTANMTISHISYHDVKLPFATYRQGRVEARMQEKVIELPDMTILQSRSKEKTISRKGLKMPGDVAFVGASGKYDYEVGPLVRIDKDFLLQAFHFRTEECTFTACTMRIIVYEEQKKGTFVPVHHHPVYVEATADKTYDVRPVDDILLKKGHRYFVGLSVVTHSGKGGLHFPAYLRKGVVRHFTNGRVTYLPATLGLSLSGKESTQTQNK